MTKYLILKKLRDADSWFSGADLAKELNLSRNAISKQIKNLKNDGYKIESTPKKGYKFLSKSETLLPTDLNYDNTIFNFKNSHFVENIDSTNKWLSSHKNEDSTEGMLCIAGKQSDGKGRKGRFWYSEEIGSICFSFLLKPDIPLENAQNVTLITALALAKTFETFGINPEIKWPNDILINGRKVSGILAEMVADLESVKEMTIGIGINHSIENFPQDLSIIATSLNIIETREELLSNFLLNFSHEYELFLDGRFSMQLEQIKSRMNIFGKEVVVTQMKRTLEGEVIAITENGFLEIITNDQKKILVTAGDLVRKKNR